MLGVSKNCLTGLEAHSIGKKEIMCGTANLVVSPGLVMSWVLVRNPVLPLWQARIITYYILNLTLCPQVSVADPSHQKNNNNNKKKKKNL